jgi:hypothetical protein
MAFYPPPLLAGGRLSGVQARWDRDVLKFVRFLRGEEEVLFVPLARLCMGPFSADWYPLRVPVDLTGVEVEAPEGVQVWADYTVDPDGFDAAEIPPRRPR